MPRPYDDTETMVGRLKSIERRLAALERLPRRSDLAVQLLATGIYERGSWVPTYSNWAATATYAEFVRIGDFVHCDAQFVVTTPLPTTVMFWTGPYNHAAHYPSNTVVNSSIDLRGVNATREFLTGNVQAATSNRFFARGQLIVGAAAYDFSDITAGFPWTWAVGDIVRAAWSYIRVPAAEEEP